MAKQKENIKIKLIGPNNTTQIEQHPPTTRKHPLCVVRIIPKNSEEPACTNTKAKFRLNTRKHLQIIVRDTSTNQEKLVTKNLDIADQVIGRRKQIQKMTE